MLELQKGSVWWVFRPSVSQSPMQETPSMPQSDSLAGDMTTRKSSRTGRRQQGAEVTVEVYTIYFYLDNVIRRETDIMIKIVKTLTTNLLTDVDSS